MDTIMKTTLAFALLAFSFFCSTLAHAGSWYIGILESGKRDISWQLVDDSNKKDIHLKQNIICTISKIDFIENPLSGKYQQSRSLSCLLDPNTLASAAIDFTTEVNGSETYSGYETMRVYKGGINYNLFLQYRGSSAFK